MAERKARTIERQLTPIVRGREFRFRRGDSGLQREKYKWDLADDAINELNLTEMSVSIRDEEESDSDENLDNWLKFQRHASHHDTIVKAGEALDDEDAPVVRDSEDPAERDSKTAPAHNRYQSTSWMNQSRAKKPLNIIDCEDEEDAGTASVLGSPRAAGASMNSFESKESLADESLGKLSNFKSQINLIPAQDPGLRSRLRTMVMSTGVQVFMMLATVWALFGGDLRIIISEKDADDIFSGVMLFVLVCFVLELCVLVYVEPNYPWSFFFWMDIIASISLIPDVLPLFGVDTPGLSSLTLARTGRAARAAARTARLSRLVKVFEIFFVSLRSKKQSHDDRYNWIDDKAKDETTDIKPLLTKSEKQVDRMAKARVEKSVLGERVLDTLFKKLFFIILLMFILFTLLDPAEVGDSEIDFGRSALGTLSKVKQVNATNSNVEPGYVSARNFFIASNPSLVRLQIENSIEFERLDTLDKRRDEEILEVECITIGVSCSAKFDKRPEAIEAAWRGLAMTIFVILLLVFGSAFLNADIKRDIVTPIERMVSMIRLLSTNPLATVAVKEKFTDETGLVEAMLGKLAVLLQMSFGAAGAALVKQNLSSSGSLVPIVPGVRLEGVFAVCVIRNFHDINEALEEEVIVFLNMVAQLIHFIAADHGGFPYSNSDGTFSIFFPERQTSRRKRKDLSSEAKARSMSKLADASFRALLEIDQSIRSSAEFTEILLQVPSVSKLQLGFGLHQGWAIAGAVGSSMKVEASYTSNDVSLATAIQWSSARVGVNFVLSETLYTCLSSPMQERCCAFDGRSVPTRGRMRLFTVDTFLYEDIEDITKVNDFLDHHAQGVEAYLSGNWQLSKTEFEQALKSHPASEHSRQVLMFMKMHNFECPRGWQFKPLGLRSTLK